MALPPFVYAAYFPRGAWRQERHGSNASMTYRSESTFLPMGTIQHIFIAPRRGEPVVSLSEVDAIADCGLRGDRYTDSNLRKSPDYQITLIESENILAFVQASGLPLALHEPRRNLVTVGVNLNDLCRKRFFVGEAELEGLELCEPCATFARYTNPEVVRFFVHKGGLRARIIRAGIIRVGDIVN